ncbi:MAG: SsrA-binding protein SmpB [Cyclobacteriaceae bacterium]|nr:SsrA-binding protein SmpB [Cyclobacteriaceae bacterium]
MSKEKSKFASIINIKNRKVSFDYELIDKYVAGLVLKGTEIKSIRMGKVTLTDGYCYFDTKGELYAKGVHISPYELGSFYNHESARERKLLLHKKELKKILSKMNEKGLTIVPVRLFVTDRGFAKLEIALAKGKKTHDKRDSIKDKDMKRELERIKY